MQASPLEWEEEETTTKPRWQAVGFLFSHSLALPRIHNTATAGKYMATLSDVRCRQGEPSSLGKIRSMPKVISVKQLTTQRCLYISMCLVIIFTPARSTGSRKDAHETVWSVLEQICHDSGLSALKECSTHQGGVVRRARQQAWHYLRMPAMCDVYLGQNSSMGDCC